jgi:uncharacterized protein (DUF433 family)
MQDVQLSEEFPLIVANPGRLGGKPAIKDTRISVQILLELAADGASIDEILEGYPFLTRDAVSQAFLFAAAQLRKPVVEAPTAAR